MTVLTILRLKTIEMQERKRQEQELLHKLEERNKKAELVRLNKERMAAQENTPESA